jgi:hypothetical protein
LQVPLNLASDVTLSQMIETMKLKIEVRLNFTHTNTLQHPPIVSLDDGMPLRSTCSTCELLDYLKSAGVSDAEIEEAVREIEQNGQTVLESATITEAYLRRVLEPLIPPSTLP